MLDCDPRLGGDSHMKGVGMLIIPLWGVNFGFWSHLGCSGQNAIIFSREALILGCTQRNIKIYIFVCFNMVSFKPGLHVPCKHKHKDVYTCDKHKHKVTYTRAEA